MYANMSHLESFRANVVSDGRSYSDETFEKAAKILNSSKKGVQVSGESIEKFGTLVAQLKVLKAAVQEEEVSALFIFVNFLFPIASIRRRSRRAS
jgi:hypothetical protein|tara:strand:- start:46 stop:330 length:285 start_codon:yes stop_codon:yes gene_type:complete